MSPIPNNPLTPEHLAQLNNALDASKAADNQIELAKRAGLDVSKLEAINQDAKGKLQQIKQVYFPGQ